MDWKEIRVCLEDMAESEFQQFTAGLVPGGADILGVRVPYLRKLAKKLAREDWKGCLDSAKQITYPLTSEEIQLQGFIIGYAKAEYEELRPYIAAHVEKISDWYLCDGFCATLKIVKQHKPEFLEFMLPYARREEEFTQRFVAVMLLNYYLEDGDIERTLQLLDSMKHPGYYRQMAVAWALATAWSGQRERVLAYMQAGQNTLDDFTYNKAIQKMIESYCVSREDKEMLRKMKRK